MPIRTETAASVIREWKHDLPILSRIDRRDRTRDITDITLRLLMLEVKEARLVSVEVSQDYDPARAADELADNLVLLVSHAEAHHLDIDFHTVEARAAQLTGQVAHPLFFDRLLTTIHDIPDRRRTQAVQEAMALIVARIGTIPGARIDAVVAKTLAKNRRNRPAEYFSDIEGGKQLNWAEQLERFAHSTKVLRYLRDEFGDPLSSWVHQLVASHLRNFPQASHSLQQVQTVVRHTRGLLIDLLLHPQPLTRYIQTADLNGSRPILLRLVELRVIDTTGRITHQTALNYALKHAGARELRREPPKQQEVVVFQHVSA